MEKSLIVAVADNNAIGRKNALLWNLPGDMKYFRQQTTGNAVIMGWMTFQSIGRPLPKRHNIVISLFPWPDAPAGVTVVDSLEAAFEAAEPAVCSASLRDPIRANAPQTAGSAAECETKAFVIGGAYTYAEAMDVVDTMHITHVHDAPEDADAFFPPIDPEVWKEESRSDLQTDPETGITYEFVVYRRR
jgi:dihydrofolate reductase